MYVGLIFPFFLFTTRNKFCYCCKKTKIRVKTNKKNIKTGDMQSRKGTWIETSATVCIESEQENMDGDVFE